MPYSLSIELNEPYIHRHFHGGERVTGHVYFHSTKDERFDNITVQLRGSNITKTVLWNNDPYGRTPEDYFHYVLLFRREETLWRGPLTCEGLREFAWPFSFTFPHFSEYEDEHHYPKIDSQHFKTKTHLLPPSLSLADGVRDSHITYVLEARLDRKRKPYQRRQVLELDMISSETALPDSRISACCRAFKINTAKEKLIREDRRRSFSEMLSRVCVLPHERNRGVRFEVEILSPNVLALGQVTPVSFVLSDSSLHEVSDNTYPKSIVPNFYLQAFEVKLVVHTQGRLPTRIRGQRVRRIHSEKESVSLGVFAGLSGHCVIPGTTVTLNQWRDLRLPLDIKPSFESYAVRRFFTLRVTVTLRCDGKDFTTKAKEVNVRVWPPIS